MLRRGSIRTGAALLIAAGALVAGCGEKAEDTSPHSPEQLTLELDWLVNADHAGIYEALDQGYFDEAGRTTADVKVVGSEPSRLPAIRSGKAEAILGGFSNVEGVDLKERGKDPTVLPVNELGIPAYDELVLVANSDTLDDKSEEIRLFIAALEHGTRDAVADPKGATKAILDAGQGLDPKLTAAEVRATLPLLLGDQANQAY